MATFMAIIWVFGLIAFVFLYAMMDNTSDDSITPVAIIVAIPTLMITSGIYYDLNNSLSLENIVSFEFWLIAGMVFLGVTTSFILLLTFIRGTNSSHFNTSGANFMGFLLTIIGFISSILGIASFYLDYLQ